MAIVLGGSGEGGGAGFSNLADIYLHARQQQAQQNAPQIIPPPPPHGGYLEQPHGLVTDSQMQQAADQRRLLQDQHALQQADFSFAENLRLQNLRNQEAQVMASPEYDEHEKANLVTQLRTHINPLLHRQQAAHAAREQAQERLVMQQEAALHARNQTNLQAHYTNPANFLRNEEGAQIGVVDPTGRPHFFPRSDAAGGEERRRETAANHRTAMQHTIHQEMLAEERQARQPATTGGPAGTPPEWARTPDAREEEHARRVRARLRAAGVEQPSEEEARAELLRGRGYTRQNPNPREQTGPVSPQIEATANSLRGRIAALPVPEGFRQQLRADADRAMKLLRDYGHPDRMPREARQEFDVLQFHLLRAVPSRLPAPQGAARRDFNPAADPQTFMPSAGG